jgi:hypothetical protein
METSKSYGFLAWIRCIHRSVWNPSRVSLSMVFISDVKKMSFRCESGVKLESPSVVQSVSSRACRPERVVRVTGVL